MGSSRARKMGVPEKKVGTAGTASILQIAKVDT